MSRLTLVRVGRNEALARAPGTSGCPRSSAEFLRFRCECDRDRCRETVVLTCGEYDRLRAGHGLIAAPGHHVAGTELAQRVRGCCVLRRAAA